MTATDELRAELTKRGVEYEVDDGKTVRVTRWKAYGEWVSFIEYDTGETRFCTDIRRFTPAQAIAATLGGEDTYTREDVEGAFVSGYSLGLDMFDSSKPEKGWNQNERNMDEEMEDLGWVRKDAATLERSRDWGGRMMSWIPVTERMPKASDEHTHDDDVLLYIPSHDRPSIVKGGEPIHLDGGIYLGHPSVTESPADEDGKTNFWGIPIEASNWIVWGYSYFFGEPKPTHWMPLPAKPSQAEVN